MKQYQKFRDGPRQDPQLAKSYVQDLRKLKQPWKKEIKA